jgi:hypothetical protein
MTNTRKVVHISTNIHTGCEHCSFRIHSENFAESVNHYIGSHGYELLHVGQETSEGSSGLWHSTVAVLGKE